MYFSGYQIRDWQNYRCITTQLSLKSIKVKVSHCLQRASKINEQWGAFTFFERLLLTPKNSPAVTKNTIYHSTIVVFLVSPNHGVTVIIHGYAGKICTFHCRIFGIIIIKYLIFYLTLCCRPTMIKYGIDNIRDLIGPKINLQVVQENPICRLK